MIFPPLPQVILTFDDAVSNHATFVAPRLKQLGFGATFFITEFVGEGPDRFATDKRQYLRWEQIREIHRLGFEIGNHTGHHRSVGSLDRAGLIDEITHIERCCAEYGISRPETFCYPGGVEDPQAWPVLREMNYSLARGCGDRPFRPGEDSLLSVPSYVIHEKCAPLFEEALAGVRDDEIIVFTFHGVPEFNHPWVNTPPEMFCDLMERLQNSRLRVGAFRDLLPLARRHTKLAH